MCARWQSFAKSTINTRAFRSQIPLLMISQYSPTFRNFYDFTRRKIIKKSQPLVPSNSEIIGSSHGWLITVDTDTLSCSKDTLLNPSSGEKIRPPEIKKIFGKHGNKHDVKKAILSAVPCKYPDNYMVCVAFDLPGALGFIKSGEKNWSYTETRRIPECEDLLFYKGKIHVVNDNYKLVSIDISDYSLSLMKKNRAPVIRTIVSMQSYYTPVKSYIVESNRGEMLLVKRYQDRIYGGGSKTSGFKVFELASESVKKPRWKHVRSLGEQALFLGENQSICVSASDFPVCKPNAIYFVDDCHIVENTFAVKFGGFARGKVYGCEIGVFSMEDGSISSHYTPDLYRMHFQRPIWVVPALQGTKA